MGLSSEVRLFDCFTFLDEFEILELRLGYLSDLLNVVVISQSYKTHRGMEWKPRLKPEHKLLKSYEGSIEFRFVYTSGNEDSVWGREKGQRSAINNGLSDLGRDDLVVISDVDEIPSRGQLLSAKAIDSCLHNLPMRTSVNYVNTESKGLWRHAKIARGRNFNGAQECRESVLLPDIIAAAGHHLTVLNGVSGWKRKYEITPHLEMILQDVEIPEFVNRDLYPSKNLIRLWGGGRLKQVKTEEFDDFYSGVLKKHPNQFKIEVKTPTENSKKSFVAYYALRNIISTLPSYENLSDRTIYLLIPILRLTYLLFFPIRFWSIVKRRGFLRSRLRKLSSSRI